MRVSTRGGELRALECAGEEPLVLLVHATSFCADVWRPVWSAACASGAAGLRAVAIDQRGHGQSFAPDDASAYAWTHLGDDVVDVAAQFTDASPSPAVILAGHSSGAVACLAAAGRRPDLVRGVLAVEPVLFERPADPRADSYEGSHAMVERARKRRAVFGNRYEARAHFEGRSPYAGFPPATLEPFLASGLVRRGGALHLRCTPEVESFAYEGSHGFDVWPDVARIRAPVRVVQAEHSDVPPAMLARLERTAPAVSVERMPGTTHFAALERPDAVGAILGRLAAELRGAA